MHELDPFRPIKGYGETGAVSLPLYSTGQSSRGPDQTQRGGAIDSTFQWGVPSSYCTRGGGMGAIVVIIRQYTLPKVLYHIIRLSLHMMTRRRQDAVLECTH